MVEFEVQHEKQMGIFNWTKFDYTLLDDLATKAKVAKELTGIKQAPWYIGVDKHIGMLNKRIAKVLTTCLPLENPPQTTCEPGHVESHSP